MLHNYLLIALRNFKRLKTYSIINITGLAIGITCALVIFLFVIDESGYDAAYRNADNIYRVYIRSFIKGELSCNSKSAGPMANELTRRYPEVLKTARIGYFGQYNFRRGNKLFREGQVYTADSTFFDIFDLEFIQGSPKTALTKPNCIVITEYAAAKYFGSENPIGKSIETEDGAQFMVTGLIRNFPKKAHFSCNYLISMCTYSQSETQNWLDLHYTTYVLLRKGTNPAELERKMTDILYDRIGPQAEKLLGIPIKLFLSKGNTYGLYLQPLKSIYLRSSRDYGIDPNTEWGAIRSSDISYIYIFIGVGFFILIIAIINFVNLATSRSERRAREVAIRKTMGAVRPQLIYQFLAESIITCAVSVFFSVILLQFALPLFNQLAEKEIKLNLLSDPYVLPALVLFTLVIGAIAGSYPAFYLSSFSPFETLKTGMGRTGRKTRLRSAMVVVQFSISITLMICTVVVKNQLTYMQNKNLGFNKECLIAIQNGASLGRKLEIFKQALAADPRILSVTASSRMFLPGIAGSAYMYNTRTGDNVISALYLQVDQNFLKTFQLTLTAGRFFSDLPTDSACVVINESMAKKTGVKNPLDGELIRIGSEAYRIIGVVKDFNCETLHSSIKPLVFHLSPVTQAAKVLTARVNMAGAGDALAFIKSEWSKYVKFENCYYQFLDEHLASLYENEKRTGTIAAVFTLLAIIIACLGLFGLAAFVAEQRVKEIGIRKVHGASVTGLVILLSKEFTKWVLLANVIAWPAAYYLTSRWLEDFPFRVTPDWQVFAGAGLTALAIALFTVGSQTVKAALSDPVRSLRYE